MNTPRINRFLGEWLDRQTSPDFFKKGLILLNAYDFLDSKADAIPGLIAHKKALYVGNQMKLSLVVGTVILSLLKSMLKTPLKQRSTIDLKLHLKVPMNLLLTMVQVRTLFTVLYSIMNSTLILAFNMMTKNSFMKTLDLMLYSIINLFFYQETLLLMIWRYLGKKLGSQCVDELLIRQQYNTIQIILQESNMLFFCIFIGCHWV